LLYAAISRRGDETAILLLPRYQDPAAGVDFLFRILWRPLRLTRRHEVHDEYGRIEKTVPKKIVQKAAAQGIETEIQDKRIEIPDSRITVLAKADEWSRIAAFPAAKAEGRGTFLTLPKGIPLHGTIQRGMSMIDGSVLYSLSIQFLVERIDRPGERSRMLKGMTGEDTDGLPKTAAIDGKTSLGSKRNKADRDAAAVHTASAFSRGHWQVENKLHRTGALIRSGV
jgi:hypothetical protein